MTWGLCSPLTWKMYENWIGSGRYVWLAIRTQPAVHVLFDCAAACRAVIESDFSNLVRFYFEVANLAGPSLVQGLSRLARKATEFSRSTFLAGEALRRERVQKLR